MRAGSSRVSRIVANPLVHFLVAGVALFGLYELVGSGTQPATEQIIVDRFELKRLAALWQARWRRPPTAEELSQIVAERVREEVFFREAIALGLDDNDVLVRRRLAQKLELALSDVAAASQASDEVLSRYYQENQAQYRSADEFTLEHKFFSSDREDGKGLERAQAGMSVLIEGGAVDDDPFHAPKNLSRQPRDRLVRVFGDQFAAVVQDHVESGAQIGQWFGPVRSSYGYHLVRVNRYSPGETLPFSEVQNQVAEEWRREYVDRATRRRFKQMRDRYQIEVAPYSSVGNLLAQ